MAGKGNYRPKAVASACSGVGPAVSVGGAISVGGYFLYPKIKSEMQAKAGTNDSGKGGTQLASSDPNATGGPANQTQFPRRILGICVNNYLFANPISYGYDPRGAVRRDFNALLTRFGDKLKIPRNQIYELSDGAIGRSDYVLGGAANQHRVPKLPRTALYPDVAERPGPTARRCRQGDHRANDHQVCRNQSRPDRVILIFVGHAVETEGKVYLPDEGDLMTSRR